MIALAICAVSASAVTSVVTRRALNKNCRYAHDWGLWADPERGETKDSWGTRGTMLMQLRSCRRCNRLEAKQVTL